MKKLIFLIIILSIFIVGCEIKDIPEPTINNYIVQPVPEDEDEYVEPLIYKSCKVLPIDENVLFYFFTDSKILWKFTSTYENQSVKITATMSFENGEDQSTQFTPDKFYQKNGYFYFSWIITPEHLDEEGTYIPDLIVYFKQKDNILEEIDVYEFGRVPDIYYASDYLSEKFRTEIDSFEGDPITKLYNIQESSYRVFYQISRNIYEVTNSTGLENGIFFNVTVSGQPAYSEGLYFFPVDRTSISKIKESGRLWVQGLY